MCVEAPAYRRILVRRPSIGTSARTSHRRPGGGSITVTARWGRSTTVSVRGETLVDLPTRHADEMSAERPLSWTLRGGSTTVSGEAGGLAAVQDEASRRAQQYLWPHGQ